MRFFTTTGPVKSDRHYCIPPLDRLDLDQVLAFVRDEKYFVLHAPRQTGKTSALLALRDRLNADGYRCVYANVEVAQTAREDVERAMRAVLGRLASQARMTLGDEFLEDVYRDLAAKYVPDEVLLEALARWAEADAKPLVLLIDEIDMLIGDSLLAVLRQLRTGYNQRPSSFPQSVVLCGVRDVRDYRIHSGSANAIIAGGSAFNVKAKSLRLGDFSQHEVLVLLGQHTAETGQAFTADALETVWERTLGQPWLVNALAAEACFEDKANRDRSRPIHAEAIRSAQERLILRRETHLDQLADKLQEDRVRRVVEPLLSGGEDRGFSTRDLEYVRDLGLVASDDPLRVANPIYAEVIPRELTYAAQAGLTEDPAWYVDDDGGLDIRKLLSAFQTFFREHSEHWSKRFQYQEAWPQLLLQAFLHRIVNSGRAHRAGVRAGAGAYGPVDRLAAARRRVGRRPVTCQRFPSRRRRGHTGRPGRDRVQGTARESGADHLRGSGADGGVHGPVRVGGRPSRSHRPRARENLGREGVPPPDEVAPRRCYRRVGHVRTAERRRPPPARKSRSASARHAATRQPSMHCGRIFSPASGG